MHPSSPVGNNINLIFANGQSQLIKE